MAYTLTYSGGTITVTDGTINTTSTSLSLPGRNYAGYGGPVDQNMVSILENFASSTSGPTAAIRGQIWFDTTNTLMKYNTSTTTTPNWVSIAAIGSNPSFGNVTMTGNLAVVNITATGDITGVNITSEAYFINSVQSGISSAGGSQGTATALTKNVNVVSTVSAGTGVLLPTTTGGLKITVINTGANSLNVYPNSGAQINSGGPNSPYVLATGGKLEFMSTSATQWYTLNATYS